MKIYVNNDLINALTIGSSMAGRSKTMNILDYAKITFKKDRIIISSFDGNSAITKAFTSEVNEDNMSFCIYPKDFLATLRTLNDETIDISVSDRNVKIKHANGVITLPTANADEYPSPTIDKETKSFAVNSEHLAYLLTEARSFVGTDELRPAMTAIRLAFRNDNTLGVTATDAHVLYDNMMENDNGGLEAEGLLPPSMIPTILSAIGDNKETTTVSIGLKNIIFNTGDCKIVVRSIEGKYPNILSVIPTSHEISVTVPKRDFIKTLNRTMVTASKATTMIKFNIKDGQTSVTTEDLDFAKSSTETIKSEVNGNDILIGINGKMLLVCIDAIESENVILEMNAPNRAVVIRDGVNPQKTVLIMPVMIQ